MGVPTNNTTRVVQEVCKKCKKKRRNTPPCKWCGDTKVVTRTVAIVPPPVKS